jgi:hypothetical protein
MAIGDVVYSVRHRQGLDSIASSEPLPPGETVTLDWPHPSKTEPSSR